MKRPLLLIPAVLLLVIAAAPREGHVQSGPGTTATTDRGLLGASQASDSTARAGDSGKSAGSSSGLSGAPPTAEIGQPASYWKPTPQPRIADGIPGEATWWNSFGHGYYVALRPDLGRNGDLVVVCGGTPFHCRTAPVITSCACKGPNSDRLVDLSLDLFSDFADPSVGVVRITLQIVGGN